VQKSIDTVITDRFDILLAERDNANGNAEEEEVQEEEPQPPKVDVKQPPAKEEQLSSPEPSTAAGSASPFAGKKRKSPSVDEDARLAAELHAQLNGGRPSRASKPQPKKKTTAKGKRVKKSADKVESDLSGQENGGKPKKKRKANPNNAFMKPLILSAPLAAFIGESQMSRPEVVKKIWDYVKANGLQDPNDKRYILCDDSLRPVFGEKVHMFTMNKVLATNMYKAEDVAQPQPAT